MEGLNLPTTSRKFGVTDLTLMTLGRPLINSKKGSGPILSPLLTLLMIKKDF